ncbi:MAG: sodium ion-translocating decarboxylase subunit beta [Planctomycetota bacterium]
MLAIGGLFIYLAIAKKFEPLLLVPIGFGILIGNIPYDASKLSLGTYDGPVSEHEIEYVQAGVRGFVTDDGVLIGEELEQELQILHGRPIALDDFNASVQEVLVVDPTPLFNPAEGPAAYYRGEAWMLNTHDLLTGPPVGDLGARIVDLGQGRKILVSHQTRRKGDKYPQLWTPEQQDVHNASVFWWLFAGVGLAGFYPPLIFLGVGALTDFGPMLSRPKTLLLGAAAQFGIFAALIGAVASGMFDLREAASIGIIGGADGPTAIFTCAQLAPHLLGAVALAAYSYMAMVPIIQPPIMKLLTTKDERLIRMSEAKPVSKRVKVFFPIVCFLITAFIAPGGLPLLGMLFFGNLLRECLVTDRLSKTAQTTFIDIVTILLGVTVGAKTSAASFLTVQTILIFVLGIVAFAIATGTGVLAAKLMNKLSPGDPVNPLIGAAGVSAVPMAARVVHTVGQKEDPQNYLLMHAMGPNVAGVIGSAVAAGVLLSKLGG